MAKADRVRRGGAKAALRGLAWCGFAPPFHVACGLCLRARKTECAAGSGGWELLLRCPTQGCARISLRSGVWATGGFLGPAAALGAKAAGKTKDGVRTGQDGRAQRQSGVARFRFAMVSRRVCCGVAVDGSGAGIWHKAAKEGWVRSCDRQDKRGTFFTGAMANLVRRGARMLAWGFRARPLWRFGEVLRTADRARGVCEGTR